MKSSSDSGENSLSDSGGFEKSVYHCPLCSMPVDRYSPDTWKEVKGWVGGPRKDSMRLREDTDRYAHGECVIKLTQGQAVDQDTLFDEPAGPPISSWSPEPWELE